MRLLFFLLPFFLVAQQRVECIVVDAQTSQPIPYVNISILETDIGVSSQEDGVFSILIAKNDLNKSIQLSSLGYDTINIRAEEFLKMKTIRMNPRSELLNEVILFNIKSSKSMEIHSLDKKMIKGGISTSTNPHKAALLFPFKPSYSETPIINKVSFYFDKTKRELQLDSKFRVRIFGVGEDTLPENDLLSQNVIVSLKRKENNIEIDLSSYRIEMPETGCFIAFEWVHLDINKYVVTKKYKSKGEEITKNIIYYAPRLGVSMEPVGKYISAEYRRGEWEIINDLENSDVTGVPAISLTLSD